MADDPDDSAQQQWAQDQSRQLNQLSLNESKLSPVSDSAPDVWATVPRPSTPAVPIAASNEVTESSTSSGSQPSAAQAVLAALAHPLPAHMLADLDPFAPSPPGTPKTTRTLGQTVKSRNSLLELLPNDDEDDNEPKLETGTHPETREAASGMVPTSPGQPSKSTRNSSAELGVTGRAAGSSSGMSSGFLGGMLRSISGTASESATSNSDTRTRKSGTATPSPPSSQQAGQSDDVRLSGKPSRPQVDTQTAQQSRAATLTRPLTSIANAFKSATGSAPNTPERAASPAPIDNEKAQEERHSLKERDTVIQASPSSPRRAGKERERDKVRDRERSEKKTEEREATFDFNKFLEQMRSRSADPVAKYLRS